MTAASVAATLAIAASGCSTPVSKPGPTFPAVRAPTTLPCRLDSRPPGGTITRYAAPAGSTWWVTYTVIANPCSTPATLDGLTLSGPQPGSGATWAGTSQVRPLRQGQIPDAMLPGDARSGRPVAGYSIGPSEQVMIVALVTAGGAKELANRVPAMKLGLTDGGGHSELRLAPDLRLCACNPLG